MALGPLRLVASPSGLPSSRRWIVSPMSGADQYDPDAYGLPGRGRRKAVADEDSVDGRITEPGRRCPVGGEVVHIERDGPIPVGGASR
jgi:hypothetical protein